jgi:hypothetical protein
MMKKLPILADNIGCFFISFVNEKSVFLAVAKKPIFLVLVWVKKKIRPIDFKTILMQDIYFK